MRVKLIRLIFASRKGRKKGGSESCESGWLRESGDDKAEGEEPHRALQGLTAKSTHQTRSGDIKLQLKAVENEMQIIERKIETLTEKTKVDYGLLMAFFSLADHCIEGMAGSYSYNVRNRALLPTRNFF